MVARHACPEDQPHRFCAQAACRDGQDERGCEIQPLVVVDQADEWTLLGNLGEQAQDAEPDQKRVRGGPCTDAERGAQRVALRDREALELIEHRRAQLM
jgi:hypothetical protein